MRAFFIIVISIFVATAGGINPVAADDTSPWFHNDIVKIAERPAESDANLSELCVGRIGLIEVDGQQGYKAACVFGSSTTARIARYKGTLDQYAYALSYPGDAKFYSIRGICNGDAHCLYSQATDTLIVQTAQNGAYALSAIKNFTTHVTRGSDAIRFYRLNEDVIQVPLYAGGHPLEIKTLSLSLNGRWAFAEVPNYGFVRIDVKTFEHTRIAAYDSLPSKPPNQILFSTIEDNGERVAIAGYSLGIFIYDISATCGDKITAESTKYFANGTFVCSSTLFRPANSYPDMISVGAPRFSGDGLSLSVSVRTPSRVVEATFAPRDETSTSSHYVAFGDSYTSGEGETNDSFYIPSTNTKANNCHVSTRSYPYLLGKEWGSAALNLACSGTRTDGVRAASKQLTSQTNLHSPTLISLGIGGNDVGLVEKLKTCVGPGSCEWIEPTRRVGMAYEIRAFAVRLVDLVQEMKMTYPSAPLFLVGYPSIINDKPGGDCSPLIKAFLNQEERTYINESIHYLNKVMKATANYTKIPFVDIESSLNGERLCDSAESAVNSIRFGNDIAPFSAFGGLKLLGSESFHPTSLGHQRVAGKIRDALTPLASSLSCLQCVFSDDQLTFPAYWGVGTIYTDPNFRQLSLPFLSLQDTAFTDTTFQFPAGTFQLGSTVRFELHSNVIELGITTVEKDGSLSGFLTLPKNIQGYHTVHAYGVSPSGTNLDIYQTVFIDTSVATSSGEINNKATNSKSIEKPVVNRVGVEEDGAARSQGSTTKGGREVLGSSRSYKNTNPHLPRFRPYVLWVYIGAGAIGIIVIIVLIVRNVKRGGG